MPISIVSKRALTCLMFALTFFIAQALAQSSPYVPKSGSDERKAIMDALRLPVETVLKRKAIFKVDHLKVKDGWAFMRGVPREADGKAFDYKGTVYEEAIKEGIFDDWICALLKKSEGKWQVVVYTIGATDVAYAGWEEEHKAPPDIFR